MLSKEDFAVIKALNARGVYQKDAESSLLTYTMQQGNVFTASFASHLRIPVGRALFFGGFVVGERYDVYGAETRPVTPPEPLGKPVEIAQASDADASDVRALFSEYLQWVDSMLQQEYGISFDVAAAVDGTMASIGTFYPPAGRLYVARQDGRVAGCACMRTLAPGVAELKRMFVRPAYRGQGIGRALVQELIADVSAAGYSTMRLDSAKFMQEAHGLYRSLGFVEREPYLESEVPADRHALMLFMERALDSKTPADVGA